jgi:response regulator RpfG family c-di-GMP phosphodiesterase
MGFTNSLLLRRFSRSGANARRESESVEQPGRVVLADGNTSDLEHMASLLRGMGFTVLTAVDGRTAWGLVRRHLPVLVMTSMDLPVQDGYMLAQKIREQKSTEHIPVMFILHAGEIPDRLIGHETQADDYIQKPFSVPEFKRRVLALVSFGGARPEPAEDRSKSAPLRETRKEMPQPAPGLGPAAQWLRHLRELLDEMTALVRHLEERFPVPEVSVTASPESPPPVNGMEAAKTGGGHEGVASTPVLDKVPPQVAEKPVSRNDEADPQDRLAQIEQFRAEFRSRAVSATGSVSPVTNSTGPAASPGECWTGVDFQPDLVKAGEGEVDVSRIDEMETAAFPAASARSLTKESATQASGEFYEQLRGFVLETLRQAAGGQAPDIKRARDLGAALVDSVRASDRLLFKAMERDQDFSVSAHCTNVAIIAVRMGGESGEDISTLHRIGLSALLHELGVVRLPDRLVFRDAPLTGDELRVLRRRPLASGLMLREAGRAMELPSEIVGQIFEREDGTGHPLGLMGVETRPEAKILALADVFEACTHRRPYRKAMSGYSALYGLSRSPAFNRNQVKALVRAVSLFPPHELLELTGGQIAEVVGINPRNPAKPRVRICFDSSGAAVQPRELDLSLPASPEIQRVLTPGGGVADK